ncbi:MAG: twin-arginine translocase subunit TatC [Methanomassiliicoccales archaeon]
MAQSGFDFSLLLQGPMMKHLSELGMRLRRIMLSLVIFIAIFFIFGPGYVHFKPVTITLPLFGSHTLSSFPVIVPSFLNSFSAIVVRYFIFNEVPHGLTIINVGAFDAIFSSLEVSVLFAIIFSMPVILTELWKFVSPGLYFSERKQMRVFIIPALLLFIAGALFAYFIVVPVLLLVVKLYTDSLGILAYVSIRSFITIVIGFMVSFGISFELPVVMITLTRFGFVEGKVWLENWRYGVMVSFIIALILSPGVTGGLIESIIGLTLSSLYMVGAVVCRRMSTAVEGTKSVQTAS